MDEIDEEATDLSGPLFFPASVQAAISEVFSTDEDPLDAAEFSAIDYINEMFPTEQSLTNLDDIGQNELWVGQIRRCIYNIGDHSMSRK